MSIDQRRPPLDPATAQALGAARRARGWSYRQAARETGVSAGHLHNLEHANRAPSLSVAEALIATYRLWRTPAETDLAYALRVQAVDDAGRDWQPGEAMSNTSDRRGRGGHGGRSESMVNTVPGMIGEPWATPEHSAKPWGTT